MNFLAHIYLSGDNEELKIGNFIADSVKGKKYLRYSENIQKGILLHRAIDTFTDSHPIVRQSTSRLLHNYSHYSSVIVDILYDHFLAANWKNYSNNSLNNYVDEFYNLMESNFELLPKRVQNFLPVMIKNNWLLSYESIKGIEKILFQMDHRTNYKSKMQFAVRDLKDHYSEFQDEFFSFFEELKEFSQKEINRFK